MTARPRAATSPLPVRHVRRQPVLIVDPTMGETVDESRQVERGDFVLPLPERLNLVDSNLDDIRRRIGRLELAILALAGLVVVTGGPQALAALKILGIL